MGLRDLARKLVFDSGRESRGGPANATLARAGAHLFGKVTDAWFNTRVEGVRSIPRQGGVMVVANHGFLAVESSVMYNTIVRGTARIPRPVVAHFAWDVPVVGMVAGAFGAVRGDRGVAEALLEAGELLLVYPGGVREASKGLDERERLMWEGRTGFVKVALKTRCPIVPAAVLGADDVYWRGDIRLDVLADLTGDRDAAIPVFMGMGPLPLPVNLTLRFGKPISMDHGPDAWQDDELVQRLQEEVRQAVEALLAGPDFRGFPAESGG